MQKTTITTPFGSVFTDHLFVMEWESKQGWHNKHIQPYQNFMINPASAHLHYGQEIFEGMKAFYTTNNHIALFRPRNNLERMNKSAEIMCMPKIDVEDVLCWLKKLITQDQTWVPTEKGTALYIRPTMVATETTLNVKPSSRYLFFIILSPVGALYSQGFNPIPILVSEHYARACPGGVGQAKAAGNYGASMRAQKEAQAVGCSQVLWLDPIQRTYIEEVGAMNIFFVINNRLVTPLLTDSILAGITRQSIIELSKQNNMPLEERRISIQELIEGLQTGVVQEIFGCGTAAVVTPVGSLRYKDQTYVINNNKTGSLTQSIFTELTNIQYGITNSKHHWLEFIE